MKLKKVENRYLQSICTQTENKRSTNIKTQHINNKKCDSNLEYTSKNGCSIGKLKTNDWCKECICPKKTCPKADKPENHYNIQCVWRTEIVSTMFSRKWIK